MSVREPVKQDFYLDKQGEYYSTAIKAIQRDLSNIVKELMKLRSEYQEALQESKT